MGLATWWDERVLPRVIDAAMNEKSTATWRRTVCADLVGEVLELGFASGRNLPHYPATVDRVLAVEPADLAWERAASRVAAFPGEVLRVGLDGAALSLPDASVDAVVSTWTLCTIPDLPSALAEVRRVLRPGARLRFVEHSLAPSGRVVAAQKRIQPVWGPFAGGCHLDRDIVGLLETAGLEVDVTYAGYISVGPAKPWGYFVTGSAAAVPAAVPAAEAAD